MTDRARPDGRDRGVPPRLAVAVVGAILLLLAVAAAVALLGDDEGSASGNGFTYRGEFYAMSGAEVADDRLGPVLDRGVPIHDTTTDVRAITGVDPAVAVAALVHDMGGTAAEGGRAWLLMSPDQDLAADPWADPDVAAAVTEEVRP